MSFVKLLMAVPDSAQTMSSILQIKNSTANQFDVEALDKLIGDMIDGAQISYTKLSTGALQATATITSTGSAVAAETITVANVVLTAVASGAVPANGQWNISGTVATQAASIALAINSIPALSGIAQATSALGVVTVTAVQPGKSGNGLAMSEAATNVTVTQFSSGSDGTQVAVNFGAAS